VLASGVAAPPQSVPARDLSYAGTKSGLRLGDSPSGVRSVYGAASLLRVSGKPGYSQLLYYKLQEPPSCYWFDNFVSHATDS